MTSIPKNGQEIWDGGSFFFWAIFPAISVSPTDHQLRICVSIFVSMLF